MIGDWVIVLVMQRKNNGRDFCWVHDRDVERR